VFSGYLHEDFLAEAGSPEAALHAFWADADARERERFQRDVKRFLAHTATLDLQALRDLVHQLGCRWTPSSRATFVGLLTDAAHLPKPPLP
jgi:hypothetical protein